MIDKLFLSIGAMKAGTTWLRHQLADHPEIFFTPEKEIHYFADPDGTGGVLSLDHRVNRFKQVMSNVSSERLNDRVRANIRWYSDKFLQDDISEAWYTDLFDGRSPDQYAADFSNLYCQLRPDQWDHVRRACKLVKVVYTLRDPADRLWSHVKFHQDVSNQKQTYETFSRSDWKRLLSQTGLMAHGEYALALRTLSENLDPDEWHLMFFEEVREFPEKSLQGLEAFLNIRVRSYPTQRLKSVINPTKNIEMPAALKPIANDHKKRQIEALIDLGIKVPDTWSQGL